MRHSFSGKVLPSFFVWCIRPCMFFPNRSSWLSYPSILRALSLQKVHIPSVSIPNMPSAVESSISLSCPLLSSRAMFVISKSEVRSRTFFSRSRTSPLTSSASILKVLARVPISSSLWMCALDEKSPSLNFSALKFKLSRGLSMFATWLR